MQQLSGDVSRYMSAVMRYNHIGKCWFIQKEVIDKLQGKSKLARFTEETLAALARMAVKDGTPADSMLRFAFEDKKIYIYAM